MAYRSFIKVTILPSFFIYNEGTISELPGVVDYTTLKNYIEEKYYFSCKNLKNKNELEFTIKNYSSLKKRFFIGIFGSKNFENSKEILKKLLQLNLMNIENCFYYENYSNEFLFSNYKNYIYINTGDKFIIYDEIQYLINYNRAITGYESIEEINIIQDNFSKNFQNFLLEKTFPDYEEFFIEDIYKYFARKKDVIIFTFDDNNKIKILNLMKKFLMDIESRNKFIVLYFDMKNIANFTADDLYFLKFSNETGVYFTDCIFEHYEKFIKDNITLEKINKFVNKKFEKINITDFKEKITNEDNHKGNRKNKNKYIIPKIVSKINDSIINDKIKVDLNLDLGNNNYKDKDSVNNFEINKSRFVEGNGNDYFFMENKKNLDDNLNQQKSVISENKIKIWIIYLVLYFLIFYIIFAKLRKRENILKYN
jgi:hypothetical protein